MFPQVEVSSPNAEIENSPLCMSQAVTDAKADAELPTSVNTEPRTTDTGTYCFYLISRRFPSG